MVPIQCLFLSHKNPEWVFLVDRLSSWLILGSKFYSPLSPAAFPFLQPGGKGRKLANSFTPLKAWALGVFCRECRRMFRPPREQVGGPRHSSGYSSGRVGVGASKDSEIFHVEDLVELLAYYGRSLH